MKKTILAVLFLVGAVIAGLFYASSAKTGLVEKNIHSFFKVFAGTSADISGLSVSFEPGSAMSRLNVTASEIRVSNLPGFKNRDLVLIKEFKANVETFPLFQGRWKSESMGFLISDINLEKNEKGELNVNQIPALSDFKTLTTNFYVGRAEWGIGSLKYQDSASNAETEPVIKDFQGALEVYDHIRDPKILIQGPALKAVYALGQGSLGLPLGKLQEYIRSQMGQQEPSK